MGREIESRFGIGWQLLKKNNNYASINGKVTNSVKVSASTELLK
jgi:hypothetical protein